MEWVHLLTKKIDLGKAREAMMHDRRNKFYQELVTYLFFVSVFVRLLLGQGGDIYDQQQSLQGLVCNRGSSGAVAAMGAEAEAEDFSELCSFHEIRDVWVFVRHLEGLLCPIESQDGLTTSVSSYHQLHSNRRFFRVGPMKLRQLRVAPTNCTVAPGKGKALRGIECYPPFSSSTEMRSSWSGGTSGRDYHWSAKHPVLYPVGPSAHIASYTYGNGGYSALLCVGEERKSCRANISDPLTECALDRGNSTDLVTSGVLQKDGWLDLSTRALTVDFVLFNPSSGVWSLASHVFEISAAGRVTHDESGSAIYVREQSIFSFGLPEAAIVLEIFMMLSVVTYVIVDMLSTFVMGRALGFGFFFGMDSWHTFEALLNVLNILLFSIFFVLEIYKDKLRAWGDGNFDFGHIHRLRELKLLADDWSAVIAFLLLTKFFKYMRVNAGLNLLFTLLSDAKADLLRFLVMFGLIFFSFMLMATIAFGGQLNGFNTLMHSFSTCFQMLAGDFDHDALMNTNSQMATFFFSSFVVLVFLILVNVFVAIISEHFPQSGLNSKDEETLEQRQENTPQSRRQQRLLIRNKLESLHREFNHSYAFYTKHSFAVCTYDVFKNAREGISNMLPTVLLKHNRDEDGPTGLHLELGQIVEFVSTNVKDQEARQQQSRANWRKGINLVRALMKMTKKGGKHETKLMSLGMETLREGRESITISLSENFKAQDLKGLLSENDLIYLDGEHLSEYRICLSVIGHAKHSTSCRVVGVGTGCKFARWSAADKESKKKPTAVESKLQGGETLTISISSLVPYLLSARFAPMMFAYGKFWKWHKYGLSAAFMKSQNRAIQKGILLSDYDIWCILEGSFLEHQIAHIDRALENDDGKIVEIQQIAGLRFDELRNAIDQYMQKHRLLFSVAARRCARTTTETARVMSKFGGCLYSMTHREREGYDYVPRVIGSGDTSKRYEGELRRLHPLIEIIAANAHEEWAMTRIKQGWKWGTKHDAKAKKHPELMPYDRLVEKAQQYDKQSATKALTAILSFKYELLLF
jgi:hypothetical protein